MQTPVERPKDNTDEGAPSIPINSDVIGSAPPVVAFPGAVENGSQGFRTARSSNRQAVDEELIQLLQVQTGNPSRDGRELAFDDIVELTNNGVVEPAGPFLEDEIARATLQGPLQPAFVDAVFTSLDGTTIAVPSIL
jgi:hypothetical protein